MTLILGGGICIALAIWVLLKTKAAAPDKWQAEKRDRLKAYYEAYEKAVKDIGNGDGPGNNHSGRCAVFSLDRVAHN